MEDSIFKLTNFWKKIVINRIGQAELDDIINFICATNYRMILFLVFVFILINILL